ncbi:hypothetical protein F4821DRAFT_243998 [Hypoxylon rubiginosum]|uniref:Uncharacterized protein n=1 Tax=Hypoxylon rubiginosum TaxID=110542 RepID=A0ACC0CTT3_9PEZI|nr:hypothetical protein F4821DRAFT_243998 [Hypoxylon rubiginosum]
MSHISNEADRDAAEERTSASNHDAPDHNAQLFCHVTMRRRPDAAAISNIQIYTRKWLPVLNGVESTQTTTAPPGILTRFPPEIRCMIYDLVCHPRSTDFDFTGQQVVYWPQEFPLTADFSVPALAHVCREMRQYAMGRYQLVWWSAKSVVTKVVGKRGKPITQHREETTKSGFGVFQPDRDVIEIRIETVGSDVELGEHAVVHWNDPTQAPILKQMSTRQVSYPQPQQGDAFLRFLRTLALNMKDTSLTLVPKQSGMWEKAWKKDYRGKFQATLKKI